MDGNVELKYYLERLIAEHDRRYEQRFTLLDEATSKSDRELKSRLDSMNEFREALKDQSGRMATRDELARLDQVVQELQRARANFDGRLLIIAGVVSIAINLVAWGIMRFI